MTADVGSFTMTGYDATLTVSPDPTVNLWTNDSKNTSSWTNQNKS